MLLIGLSEGDYVMIGGSVKVSFDHKNGANSIVIGIEAPKDVDILRGTYYEREIAQLAAKGDAEAIKLYKKLEEEHEARRHKSEIRGKKRKGPTPASKAKLTAKSNKWDGTDGIKVSNLAEGEIVMKPERKKAAGN